MGVEPDHVLDLLAHLFRLRRRQVDLVQDRDDLVVVVERLIDIGERLRLDALARIDHQERALAGGEAAVHLIGEIDMARRVDEVQLVELAVLGAIVEAHGLRLDGDAALPLDIHGIEHLLLHLPRGQAPAELDQPVGEGGFAVIDMGDDGEISDAGKRRGLGMTHVGLVESAASRVKRAGRNAHSMHAVPMRLAAACLSREALCVEVCSCGTALSQSDSMRNKTVDGAPPHDAYCACVTLRHS